MGWLASEWQKREEWLLGASVKTLEVRMLHCRAGRDALVWFIGQHFLKSKTHDLAKFQAGWSTLGCEQINMFISTTLCVCVCVCVSQCVCHSVCVYATACTLMHE